jgi:hypothetical protein
MNKQDAMNEVARLNPNSTSIVALSGDPRPWVQAEYLVRFEGCPLPRRYELYTDGFLWLKAA